MLEARGRFFRLQASAHDSPARLPRDRAGITLAWDVATLPAAPTVEPPMDPALVAGFREALQGKPADFAARPFDAAAAERETAAAWAAYRQAAVAREAEGHEARGAAAARHRPRHDRL